MKKSMQYAAAALAAVTAASLFPSCGVKTGKVMAVETPYAYTISQLGTDEMPIMSYIAPLDEHEINGVTYPSLVTDDMYAKLQTLGINLMHGIGHGGYMDVTETLDMCQKYDMAGIVSYFGKQYLFKEVYSQNGKVTPFAEMTAEQQDKIKSACAETMNEYCSHPAFAGGSLSDEEGIMSAQMLGDMTAIYNEVAPDKLALLNCMGSGANEDLLLYSGFGESAAEALGFTASDLAQTVANATWKWGAYVENYVDIVKPNVFSYDHYPWKKTGGALSGNLMREFETAAKISAEHKVPFWNFIQTGQWHAVGVDNCREPTYNEMAYQINASLVFGAQGIECFLITPLTGEGTYGSDVVDGQAKFIFDLYGNPTNLYAPLKKIFDNIKSVDDVLMHSVWKGVMETESLENSMNAVQTLSVGYALPSFNQVKALQAESAYALAGCFNYQGHTALYVMHANTDKMTEEADDITVQFNAKVKGYSLFGGEKTSFTGNSFTIKNLAPGEAALIVIE